MARVRTAAPPTSAAEVGRRFRDALTESSYAGNLSALARDIARDEGAEGRDEIAAKIGTVRSQLQKIQRGEHMPEALWAGRLSAKLGKPLHHFNVPEQHRTKSGRKPSGPTAEVLAVLRQQTQLLQMLVRAEGLEVPPDTSESE